MEIEGLPTTHKVESLHKTGEGGVYLKYMKVESLLETSNGSLPIMCKCSEYTQNT